MVCNRTHRTGGLGDGRARGLVALAHPIAIVGVGPGSGEYLLPAAAEAVRAADVLVGGRNALALFDFPGKERRLIEGDLDGVLEYIDAARQTRRVAVLLSGDPGFFSLLPRLRRRFGANDIAVIPGVSSLQLACARLGIKWDDLAVASVHGRGPEGLEAIAGGSALRAAMLTGPKFPPGAVCRCLLEQGSNFSQAWVLTDLGLPGEEITSGSLEAIAGLQGRGNSILILSRDGLGAARLQEPAGEEPDGAGGAACAAGKAGVPGEGPEGDYLDVVTPGLPDELFVQGDAAISQEEARALTLCKARLKRGMTVYEIGAGTGSWTVEAARLVDPGTVWAVERNPEAAALVRANIRKFGVDNVNLVEGSAPEACRGWPPADRLLIGGSGGRLPEILFEAGRWLRPRGRLVITAVTPDTFTSAWKLLQEEPWVEPDTVLVNVARVASRGGARIWSGENPVFILSASLKA
jgi:precorrin-6Y C5,15-methyltransferase (decarboxylating)